MYVFVAVSILFLSVIVFGYREYHKKSTPTQLAENYIPQPKESDWVKYQATCDNLKDSITLYYPQGWQYKEFPNVTDMVHAGTKYECQVLFGYGGRPESYQSPTPGVKTIIRVSTWVDKESLEDYSNTLLRQSYSYVENPTEEKINNTVFTRMVIKDAGGSIYITKKNDRFFAIQLPSKKNEDKVDVGENIETINKEFINRIRLIQ